MEAAAVGCAVAANGRVGAVDHQHGEARNVDAAAAAGSNVVVNLYVSGYGRGSDTDRVGMYIQARAVI